MYESINRDVLEKRLQKIRNKLEDNEVDGILITKRENYMYLSGFNGTSAQLIITKNDAVLVTDFRYIEQASKQAPFFDIVRYHGDVAVEINNILKKSGVERLGFESMHLTYGNYLDYKEKFEIKELIPLKNVTESMRIIKDPEELKLIKTAVKIADEAFDHILPYIKPGVRETEIAAEIEYFIKRRGGEGPSFQTIVASGARSAMPHGVASEKEIEAGDIITMDYGTIYGGYCSDITRTVFLGKPDGKMVEIYNTVLMAQKEALKGAHRGMTGKEIDSISREIINRAGFENNFGHGLGHGVGLEIHENPRFAPSDETIMENGMVVTVEPGIYIVGYGGVRIEDMIVIRDDKPEVLTSAPKDIMVL
ncbi:MAG: aminopeptidase P family protein [Firmicutes bacterium]|nr:aminopeptidase P family protein [Bacillota bacterium]